MPELIFEIGTEELPAGFVDPALAFIEKALDEALTNARLPHGAVVCEGTPRRLVALVDYVEPKQAPLEQTIAGPPISIAFSVSAPADHQLGITAASGSFFRKQGISGFETGTLTTWSALHAIGAMQTKDPKGNFVLGLVRKDDGKPAAEVLAAILEDVIARIPFKKTMSWGDAKFTHKQVFGRPVQWILALFDGRVVPVTFADVTSGSTTRGHRYHAPAAVTVKTISEYRRALEAGHVVLSRDARRQMIVDGAQALAKRAGGALLRDDALLEIVKNLVEKPFPVLGVFEQRFLEMPKELLVSEMREHQKYFAVTDANGALLPAFVVVAGSDAADKAALAAGNARVLRARFEDGAFYFKTDLERTLGSRIEDEKKVVFHRELGTLWEKTARICAITEQVARDLDIDEEVRGRALSTALLCKADLTTGVVNEFPELQGIMGRTYAAREEGLHANIAIGIDEHYAPRNAAAALPSTTEGALVGLADRIDTIVGILGVGKAPTGSADPFALRRAAIAIVNVMMERGWRMPLSDVVTAAIVGYRVMGKLAKVDEVALGKTAVDFIRGRVRGVLIERCEARGLVGASDIVDAAMAARAGVDVLPDVEENAIALAELRARDAEAFTSLCKTFKRVGNILKDARKKGDAEKLDDAALKEPAETDLLRAVSATRIDVSGAPSLDVRRKMLSSAALLKPKVDRFFDDVMVMADDLNLRAARLGLLAEIERVFVDVADFTKVQVEG